MTWSPVLENVVLNWVNYKYNINNVNSNIVMGISLDFDGIWWIFDDKLFDVCA